LLLGIYLEAFQVFKKILEYTQFVSNTQSQRLLGILCMPQLHVRALIT